MASQSFVTNPTKLLPGEGVVGTFDCVVNLGWTVDNLYIWCLQMAIEERDGGTELQLWNLVPTPDHQ